MTRPDPKKILASKGGHEDADCEDIMNWIQDQEQRWGEKREVDDD